ncbi:hypothetical protein AMS68_000037 [Peltaster fructicola]|uniref:Heterokaryon incompatibility domain-containing protein n=1 Tax=Peltaster fructicola TaxID=286661 RepID=A0A6H0XJ11_9PEZI|nr:hypothetical protein AMS68_000037 [Peltaster fructicola]
MSDISFGTTAKVDGPVHLTSPRRGITQTDPHAHSSSLQSQGLADGSALNSTVSLEAVACILEERLVDDEVRWLLANELVEQLCRRCRRQLDRYYTWRNELPEGSLFSRSTKRYTVAKLTAGTRLGCKFCCLMLSTLQLFRWTAQTHESERPDHKTILELATRVSRHELKFDLILEDGSPLGINIALFRTQRVQRPAQSAAPLDLAKQWLQTCATSHDCSSRYEGLQLPTRLIWIADSSLRLVETTTCSERPIYATLSYCWGTTENVKLTERSYASFHREISQDELQPTYRDAIKVARALDLEWIWIDALCIIQDQIDHRDWRSEAAIMGDIYGGGYINLAASTSSDVGQGALKPEGSIAGFTTKVGSQLVYIYVSNAWELAVTGSTLSRRGWAFQERLLAPRTLYLSNLGLFWECSGRRTDEYSPEDFQHSLHVDDLCLGRRRAWHWQKLVERYTRAKLSHAQDRLVAISGLARCQQAMDSKDTYLAGLWKKSLELQLTWGVNTPCTRTQSSAPTWSWASVDGGVKFAVPEDGNLSFLSTAVDASTRLVGSDVFGEVTSGILGMACRGLVQTRLEVNRRSGFLVHRLRCNDGSTTVFELDCQEDALLRVGDFAYLLPITESIDSRGFSPMICSLVLQTCYGGTFRRIGIHKAFGLTPIELRSFVYPLLERGGEPAVAAAVCHEMTPGGRYVVTII